MRRDEVTSEVEIERWRPGSGRSWSLPDRIVTELVVLLLVWSVAALLFALVGWFHWWTVLPTTLGLWRLCRRWLPKPSAPADGWWVAAAVLAIGLAVLNGLHPGEHLFTGRDGGTYLAIAGWLAQEGTLWVDARSGPLADDEQLEFDVPGFYDRREDGRLEPQFMHAFPVVLGTLVDLGGVSLALLLNPVVSSVGLLALFALARRHMRGWAALAAMATVGFSLVFLFYARTPFSEPLMATLLISGIWLVGISEERADPSIGLLAGFLLGAATMARLDGILLLLPVTLYVLVRGSAAPQLHTVMLRIRHGMLITAVVGVAEVLLSAPLYVTNRSRFVLPVLLAWLGLLIAYEPVRAKLGIVRSVLYRNRRALFSLGVALTAVLLAYAWFVRPVVVEVPGSPYGLDVLQEQEGLKIESDRSYAEHSVEWLTWYQGPSFVVLAFAGMAMLVRKDLLGKKTSPGWLTVAVLATFALIYLWRPLINPDHIWAMRRFLTTVIPLGALFAALAVNEAVGYLSARLQEEKLVRGLAVSMALLVVLPPLAVSSPVWDIHEFSGLKDEFRELCDWIGPDGHVLILDGGYEQAGHRLAQSLRSYCGVPAAWNGHMLSEDSLTALDDRVEHVGGRLVLLSPGELRAGTTFFKGPYAKLEITLSHPPKGILSVDAPVTLRTSP